jgi:alpha-beta hydrolase superfamily lysophospholipase
MTPRADSTRRGCVRDIVQAMTGLNPRTVFNAATCVGMSLALAACGTNAKVDSQSKDLLDAGKVTLKQVCSDTLCAGERDEAPFQIKTPGKKDWNGTLIIWSHGYRNAGPIPSDPLNPSGGSEQPDRTAEASPIDEVSQELVGQGFALAGSAFKSNGWDVTEAVTANEDLYKYFSDTFGKPRRVYIWGASLGGLITQTLAETKNSWISGVAPLCGVLGGTNLNLDLALDVAYAVKTLIYPGLKLSGFTSQQEAVDQWEAASKAVVAKATSGGAEGIADLLTIASISGAPSKTERFDGHDATSTGQAYAQSIITALGYGTWGRYDIEQRVGGNASQNADVDYSKRVDDRSRTLINAAAPGMLAGVLAKLADGERVSADAPAREKANTLGDPTGAVTLPTITLHTIDDPLVISQNETVFAQRAAKNSSGRGSLVQLFTEPPAKYATAPYGAGHCNFTRTELTGVVTLLDDWVRHGQYAGPGAVNHVFGYNPATTPAEQAAGTAQTGYSPITTAGPWPAANTG